MIYNLEGNFIDLNKLHHVSETEFHKLPCGTISCEFTYHVDGHVYAFSSKFDEIVTHRYNLIKAWKENYE